MNSLVIYCADVGSIANDNFGWARLELDGDGESGGSSIDDLSDALITDLLERRPVSLGFECPLFVPLPEDSRDLGRGREGEGSRPWSAHAGAASMAAGIAQVPWVLGRIAAGVAHVKAHLDWQTFSAAEGGLFLWEAFVTANAKGVTHEDDAMIGARAFRAALPDPTGHNALPTGGECHLPGGRGARARWVGHRSCSAQCACGSDSGCAPP
jgi:hypothetical protein